MKNKKICIYTIRLLLMVMVLLSITTITLANNEEEDNISEETLKYYMGSAVNTGKDNGFSKENYIEVNDPHYGWDIGKFFISGYTRVLEDDENPIFLKNVGDELSLNFILEQDINKLNDDKNLVISEDKNGYDKYFDLEKQNFKRGALIIKHTDYQNLSKDPVVYTDYLKSKAVEGENTKVDIFEEGDYEVSLNYEIKNKERNILGLLELPKYTNYKISFSFSVRNGNCMVYPFDVLTGEELTNESFTENGFYLDLANSRYLGIDIKREILNDKKGSVVLDTRFNKPAKDKEKYTQEGIYTITVNNKYTKEETIKKIYVGENDILKASVTTGLDISEINKYIDDGAVINNDGTIKTSSGDIIRAMNTNFEEYIAEKENETSNNKNNQNVFGILPVVIILSIIILISTIVVIRKRKHIGE